MKTRTLAALFTLALMLGPVEPVFAQGQDISSQFPDVVSGRNTWAVENTNGPRARAWGPGQRTAQNFDGPWTVEMWSRGRRRYKHFKGANAVNNYYPDSGNARFGGPSSYYPGGYNSYDPTAPTHGNYNSYNVDNNPYNGARGADTPPSAFAFMQSTDLPFRAAGTAQPVNRPVVPSAIPPRGGDKFVDNAQVDTNGIRRFGNGRHHDLSSMPIDQALTDAAVSDEALRQQQAVQAGRRPRARMRFDQFNGGGLFNF